MNCADPLRWGPGGEPVAAERDASGELGLRPHPVFDLSLLKEIPLKELLCDFKPYRDTDILRSIKTLEKINNKPAEVF